MIGTTLSDRAAISSEGIKADAVAVSGLNMIATRFSPGAISESSSSHFASQRGFETGEAGDVPTRAVEPRDDVLGDGVGHTRKDDRDRPSLPLDGNGRRGPEC